MSSTIISYRPSSTINWADDDDDDFEFDTWKTTADISAPTMADLPSLQRPPAEVELPFTIHYGKPINEAAPWVTLQTQHIEPSLANQDPSTYDWSWGKPTLASHLVNGRSVEKPAYKEMSGYEDGTPSADKRINYSIHWAQMKANSGFDCRLPVQWRFSPLREVTFSEQDDTLKELFLEDFFELALEDVAHKTEPTQDEGYYSEDSPPISPTLAGIDEKVELLSSASHTDFVLTASNIKAITFKHKYRRSIESMDLKDVKIVDSDNIYYNTTTPSPDVKYIDQNPTTAAYISNTLATGWFYMFSVPWATTSILVAGALAAGAITLARRR
jgi:hypothetical protein